MEEKVIQVSGSITVDELASALGISVTHLIGELFKKRCHGHDKPAA